MDAQQSDATVPQGRREIYLEDWVSDPQLTGQRQENHLSLLYPTQL